MGKLNEKQRLRGRGGGALFLCLLGGGGVYWANGLVEDETAAIAAKQGEIKAAEAKIAKIPNAEREVIVLRENLSEYVRILPNGQELEEFINVIWEFERQSGVSIGMFKPGAKSRQAKNSKFSSVVYQFELTATIWQTMRFMNLLENHERFIKVNALQLKSGGKKRPGDQSRSGDEIVHDIKLTVETFVYDGAGAGKEVLVPNYANKRDALSEEIFKRQQKIRMDKYDFKGDLGRRDIFVDPRLEPGEERGDLPLEEQKRLLDNYIGIVQGLRDLFRRAKDPETIVLEQYRFLKSLKEGLAIAAPEIKDIEERGLISYVVYDSQWKKDVRQPLLELQERIADSSAAGAAAVDPWLDADEFEGVIAQMEDDLSNGDLAEAKGLFEGVRDKIAVPADDERFALRVRLEGLYKRTAVAIEFSKKTLDIQGVMVNEAGLSGVLLNGTVYEEGEYIDEDLFVRTVSSEQVAFVYQGFVLIKTW